MSRRLEIPAAIAVGELAVRARGIGVQLDGKRILEGVDLDLHAGEVLALIGPNGAGKSTLLGVLSGDAALTTGTVEIAGVPLGDWHLQVLARQRAVLAQSNAVAFPFSVAEIVEMGRAPWRRTPLEDDDESAIAEAMELTEVTRFAERAYPSLSGGERARASLARVLAQRTGIVMLDEPTAALDLKHQEAVLRIARERAAAGDAVVVVLHDLNLAAAYADRVALLADGRLHSAGAPEQVLTAETIAEVYQHPVEIVRHPRTGRAIVVPLRD